MSNSKHNRNKKDNKKEDGKFDSKKNVKHDPQGESARDVFGLKKH
ncbi:MAG: CPC_1213 family protein [Anaerovoracaceae bacterium]|jgi:hypothetical protein